LRLAYKKGFRTFRFTGGEPTLYAGWKEILSAVEKFGNDTKILFTTNGFRLGDHIAYFSRLRNVNVFISVDSIGKKFRGLPKIMTAELEKNIKRLAKKVCVRVNMVVMKENIGNVPKMVEFCRKTGIDIKLHDVYICDEIIDPKYSAKKFWRNNFVSLSKILPWLKSVSDRAQVFPGHGPYGIPMTGYIVGKTQVIIKNSDAGTRYLDSCGKCPMFPCRHGLYVPQISNDGFLYPANCIDPDFLQRISGKSGREVLASYENILKILRKSKHRQT
jgi:MoaA/NifB/PqqE/SkfB family radical SAM enzyme